MDHVMITCHGIRVWRLFLLDLETLRIVREFIKHSLSNALPLQAGKLRPRHVESLAWIALLTRKRTQFSTCRRPEKFFFPIYSEVYWNRIKWSQPMPIALPFAAVQSELGRRHWPRAASNAQRAGLSRADGLRTPLFQGQQARVHCMYNPFWVC